MNIGIYKFGLGRLLGVIALGIPLAMTGCGKTYSRDEFSKTVMNKTEADVKSSLGEPDWISDGEPVMWTYRHTTKAGEDKERDAQAVITFAPGSRKVVDVRFE